MVWRFCVKLVVWQVTGDCARCVSWLEHAMLGL
jgi:hypothetical protein